MITDVHKHSLINIRDKLQAFEMVCGSSYIHDTRLYKSNCEHYLSVIDEIESGKIPTTIKDSFFKNGGGAITEDSVEPYTQDILDRRVKSIISKAEKHLSNAGRL